MGYKDIRLIGSGMFHASLFKTVVVPIREFFQRMFFQPLIGDLNINATSVNEAKWVE